MHFSKEALQQLTPSFYPTDSVNTPDATATASTQTKHEIRRQLFTAMTSPTPPNTDIYNEATGFNKNPPVPANMTPTPPHDTATASNNYSMTSDDKTNDKSSSTDELIFHIENLEHELQLERENNKQLLQNATKSTETAAVEMTEMKDELYRLNLQYNEAIKAAQAASIPTTSTPHAIPIPPPPPPTVPQPTAPPPPPTIDPNSLVLIQQQQQMLYTHMAQSNSIMQQFGHGISALQSTTLKSAQAQEQQALDNNAARM